jgi:hypothetical protein
MVQNVIFSIDLTAEFKHIQDSLRAKNSLAALKAYADNALLQRLKALALKLQQQLAAQLSPSSPHYKNAEKIAWEILRREHIQYLAGCFPAQGIIKEFDGYKSMQIPVGEKIRNCYHRWEPGLAAFRKHVFLRKNAENVYVPLIEYYHHASAVVYEEPDFKNRIEGTEENFQQMLREAKGKHLTEIRLLSTNKGMGGDYKQVLATYLAAIRESTPGQNITVFFYGLNLARFLRASHLSFPFYHGNLQEFINTRSTNELFKKAFLKMGIPGPDLRAIEDHRKKLDEAVKALDLSRGEEVIEKEFLGLLEAHQTHEKELWKEYKDIYRNFSGPLTTDQKLIHDDVDQLLDLRKSKRYIKPKYNGQLQATLVRLSRHLDEEAAIGCNDAKNRDSRLAMLLEAIEIYKARHDHYPDTTREGIEGKNIQKELEEIQIEVYRVSTPVVIAEYVSWPHLARGLDSIQAILPRSPDFPNEQGQMAGYFKKIYGNHGYPLPPDLAYEIQKPKAWAYKESDFNITQEAKHIPGKLEKTLILEENKNNFKTYENNQPPPDEDAFTPHMHKIEVYTHEVKYEPPAIPQAEMFLRKIVLQMLREAITTFKPTPAKLEDLCFEGNTAMKKIALEISKTAFRRKDSIPGLDQLQFQQKSIEVFQA